MHESLSQAPIRRPADDRIDAVTPLPDDAERPTPRIAAHALMLVARQASHAVVGRALWRAAAALSRPSLHHGC